MARFPCPCCGYLTFGEQPPGTFGICPVCYWEDDNVQFDNQEISGGANKESLNQARRNFLEFGASSKERRALVRSPSEKEVALKRQQE